MRLLLSERISYSNKTIYGVNPHHSEELKSNFRDVLEACDWREDYLGHESAVALMVDGLLTDYGQKIEIAHPFAVCVG